MVAGWLGDGRRADIDADDAEAHTVSQMMVMALDVAECEGETAGFSIVPCSCIGGVALPVVMDPELEVVVPMVMTVVSACRSSSSSFSRLRMVVRNSRCMAERKSIEKVPALRLSSRTIGGTGNWHVHGGDAYTGAGRTGPRSIACQQPNAQAHVQMKASIDAEQARACERALGDNAAKWRG